MKDYLALSQQYEAAVIRGEIAACKWVRLACQRNERDRTRIGTVDFPYEIDVDKATRICRFAEMLPHIKGPKAKVVGYDAEGRRQWATIELEPWQCWILTTVFGWVHADTGLRRFRVCLVLIPRKNAKSTMAAIIALYMLVADGESGPECYSAATTRDQAKVVAEICWEMAHRSPQFCEYYGVRIGSETSKSLAVPSNAGKFMPLSADANSLDGLNISFAAVDELHAHKTPAVWQVIDTGTGTRDQPLVFGITTAGVDTGGICYQKLGYLEKVLDQVATDETFFGINYTIDQGDDIALEAVQRKANPNYGVSVKPDDLTRKIAAARHAGSDLNDVLTKHFNVWIRAVAGWMTATQWQGCTVPGVAWHTLSAYPCWIGVDLGEVRDFSAVVLVFKTGADTYAVIPTIYVPAEGVRTSPIAQLSGWVRDGWIIETPGSEADYQRIEDDLLQWQQRLKVIEIDFDRRSARLMMQKLRQRLEPALGRDRVEQTVLDIPQNTATFDPAMTVTQALIEGKRIQHDGNPAMAWMVSNVVVNRNRDEKYPSKAGGKDSEHKIDAPVAMWTAFSQAMKVQMAEPTYQIMVLGGSRR